MSWLIFFHALTAVNNSTGNPLNLEDLALDGSRGNTSTDCSHVKSTVNVKNSWTNTSKYVYPLMDWGALERSTVSGGHYSLNAKNATPCVFAKAVLDEIFWEAGTNVGLSNGTYSYKSDFLNGVNLPANYVDFTKLIVPLDARKRKITINATINFQIQAASTNQTLGGYLYIYLVTSNPLSTSTEIYYVDNELNSVLNSSFSYTTQIEVLQGDTVYFSTSGKNASIRSGSTFSITYDSSDKLGVDGSMSVKTTIGSSTLGNILFNSVVSDPNGTYNATTGIHTVPKINIAGFFSKNTKQVDFIMGIVKMFNLYIQPDKYNPYLLYIEPRDSFYGLNGFVPTYGNAPITVDWTNKLDISQPVEQDPMGDLQGKVYWFTHKSDNDFWNKLYTEGGNENIGASITGRTGGGWNEIYGQYRYNIDNDFQSKDYKIESTFSPTVLVSYDVDNTLPLPIIFSSKINSTPFSVEAQYGQLNNCAGNLRLLYYGGLKTCSNGWYLTEDPSVFNGYNGLYPSGISNPMMTYPYAGHLNDPYTPGIDLNYYLPYEVYYLSPNYTSNGLFNVYWANFVAQTTDTSSKLVTGYFRLAANDIMLIDFRNQVYVDGHYYYLHTVEEYDPINEGLTKVTLLKINTVISLNVAQRNTTKSIGLGRIISGSVYGALPIGWPAEHILPSDGFFATGLGGGLKIGTIIGSNIKDKIINGVIFGGLAGTINYPFKILTTGAEIAKSHVVGNNAINI